LSARVKDSGLDRKNGDWSPKTCREETPLWVGKVKKTANFIQRVQYAINTGLADESGEDKSATGREKESDL